MRKTLIFLGCVFVFVGCHNTIHKRHKKPPRKHLTEQEEAALDAADAQAYEAHMHEPIGKKESDIVLKEGNPTSVKTIDGIEILSYLSDVHTVVDSDTLSSSKAIAVEDGNSSVGLSVGRAKGEESVNESTRQSFFEKDYFFKKGICVDYKEVTNN